MTTANDPAATTGTKPPVTALLRAMRPRQWVKNLLVFAAPAAAGLLGDPAAVGRAVIALVAFVAASAAVYLLNDVRDLAVDQAHPVKRHRPIAAGHVAPGTALVVAAGLTVGVIALSAMTGTWSLLAVVGVYLLLNLAYSLGLKRVPLLEMVVLASGFVLRALGGAVAVDVPVSSWFLIVVSAGALHVVVSKRIGELVRVAGSQQQRRSVVDAYTLPLLTEIRTVAVGVAVFAYLLWAFEQAAIARAPVVYELSAVPFVLAMFRYSSSAATDGDAESPEAILLKDRHLVIYGLLWAVLFGIALAFGDLGS